MIKTAKYPEFSDVDFIRLYCAINLKNKLSPIITHHELEKGLYEFYHLPEFRELFQDICPKTNYIVPKNSYLDLTVALNTAQLFGILTPITGTMEIKSIISCDENLEKQIIASYNSEMVDKMNHLVGAIYDLQGSKQVKIKSIKFK